MEKKVKKYLEELYSHLNIYGESVNRRIAHQMKVFQNSTAQAVEFCNEKFVARTLYIAVDCDETLAIREDDESPDDLYACHGEAYLIVLVTENDIKLACRRYNVWRSLMPGVRKTIYKDIREHFEELSDDLFYEGNWIALY
jgi:hypothetical protein